jgi:hypothetical protein
MADNLDAILAPLMAQGFSPSEAQNAYQAVTSCALGTAVNAIRELRAVAAGRAEHAELARVVAERDESGLPHLRTLLAEISVRPLDSFEARITTVVAGIAARRGDDWEAITGRLERVLGAHA